MRKILLIAALATGSLIVSCSQDQIKTPIVQKTPQEKIDSEIAEMMRKKYEDERASQPVTPVTTGPDAYELMSSMFKGSPSKEEIQPLLEAVVKMYNFPTDNESLLHVASMLIGMTEKSPTGVSEMRALKHMFQHGNTELSIQNQCAMSYIILEKTE